MHPVIHRPSLPIPLPLARGGTAATTAGAARLALGLGTIAVQDYEEDSFATTTTGFTVNPTPTLAYIKVGNIVYLSLPLIAGTSNATTFNVIGLPANLRPPGATNVGLSIGEDNGVNNFVLIQLTNSDTISLLPWPATAWSTSGNKFFYGAMVVYILP